jgi:hypothetical protein
MGLSKRLATGWPTGQPVANSSAISLEQQTDSQTSKSPTIVPDQHQIHTTFGATERTGTGSVRAPCPCSSDARSTRPIEEERGLAPSAVPVPVLPTLDPPGRLRKIGDWLRPRCLSPIFRLGRQILQTNHRAARPNIQTFRKNFQNCYPLSRQRTPKVPDSFPSIG